MRFTSGLASLCTLAAFSSGCANDAPVDTSRADASPDQTAPHAAPPDAAADLLDDLAITPDVDDAASDGATEAADAPSDGATEADAAPVNLIPTCPAPALPVTDWTTVNTGVGYANLVSVAGTFFATRSDKVIVESCDHGGSWAPIAHQIPSIDSLRGLTSFQGKLYAMTATSTSATVWALDDWTSVASLIPSGSGAFYDLASDATTLVALGDGGGDFPKPYAWASTDGTTFKQTAIGVAGSTVSKVRATGSFTIVGGNGAIYHSPDGVTWSHTLVTTPTPFSRPAFTDVAGAASTIVAVGLGGKIFVSTDDGAKFNAATASGTTTDLLAVAYNGSNWVAAGRNGTLVQAANPSGTWTAVTSGVTSLLTDVIADGAGFVAVGRAATSLTSVDGVSCVKKSGTDVSNDLTDVAFAGTIWFALGYAGSAISTDGAKTFTPGALGPNFSSLASNGTVFVASSDSGLSTSSDGVTWTSFAQNWQSSYVAYGGGRFVAIGLGTALTVFTSPDGTTWSRQAVPGSILPTRPQGLSYAGGKFIGSGYDISSGGSKSELFSSPDGVTWTDLIGTSATTRPPIFSSIASNGTTFVAAASGSLVYLSPDLVTFTPQTVPFAYPHVSFVDGVFMAAAESGVVATSVDGAKWTPQTTATSATLSRTAAGPGLLVSVGANGTIVRRTRIAPTGF